MTQRRTVILAALAVATSSCAHASAHDEFFRAIELDQAPQINALLRRGFDPNTRDAKGVPALVLALHSESYQAALALAQARGLQANARNAKGETALMMAALRGRMDIARALITRGADVNQEGWAPLHYAASSTADSATDMTALLLEHHAYIDATSPNGTTPLMMAVRYGKSDVALQLVRAGADPAVRNERGLGALEFARQAGRDDMVDLITQALRRRQPARRQW